MLPRGGVAILDACQNFHSLILCFSMCMQDDTSSGPVSVSSYRCWPGVALVMPRPILSASPGLVRLAVPPSATQFYPYPSYEHRLVAQGGRGVRGSGRGMVSTHAIGCVPVVRLPLTSIEVCVQSMYSNVCAHARVCLKPSRPQSPQSAHRPSSLSSAHLPSAIGSYVKCTTVD